MHQTLQVEVVGTGLERDLDLPGGRVDQLHAGPAIEIAALQPLSKVVPQRLVLVHPDTPPAA